MKALILTLSLLALTACGKGSGGGAVTATNSVVIDSSLVGTWVMQSNSCGANQNITISADGKYDLPQHFSWTCVLTGHYAWTSSGDVLTYTFLNSTTANCGTSIVPETNSLIILQSHYKIDGIQLTLTNLTGTCTVVLDKQ